MRKIKRHSYKLYAGHNKQNIIFDEENLNFIEVTPLHASLIKKLHSQKNFLKTIDHLKDPERKKIRWLLNDLGRFGFFDQLKSHKRPKGFSLEPEVRAFRLVLTEECNLRCKECFVTRYHRKNVLKTMSQTTLTRIIKKTIPYGFKVKITYHFFGGEPLIRFNCIKKAVEIINEAVWAGKMIKPNYLITTNLTLLNEEMVRFFKKNNFKVGVSIDGPENINSKFRIYKNGRSALKDIKRNYRRLIKAGVKTRVLITPHLKFTDQLPQIFRYIIKLFPTKIIIINTPFHYRTLAWNIKGAKYAKVLIELFRLAKKYKITLECAAVPVLFALSNGKKQQSPCVFDDGCITVSINPEGRVSFCPQNWCDVLTVAPTKRVVIPIKLADECKTCEARHVCGGPCPAFQLISGKKIDKQKCQFMHIILKEIAAHLDLFRK